MLDGRRNIIIKIIEDYGDYLIGITGTYISVSCVVFFISISILTAM